MKLTGWEVMKVFGRKMAEIGEQAEQYEEEHPGEQFKLEKNDAVGLGVDLVTAMGIEILD